MNQGLRQFGTTGLPGVGKNIGRETDVNRETS